MNFIIVLVLILALWSITRTLEKLANKIIEKQDKQNQLLEEIKLEYKENDKQSLLTNVLG